MLGWFFHPSTPYCDISVKWVLEQKLFKLCSDFGELSWRVLLQPLLLPISASF